MLARRLFREKPVQEPLLLIYRDKPCVVIGRNQNPWKEVNFQALRRASIPFIRRRSGGGTVYHVRASYFCLGSSILIAWAHNLGERTWEIQTSLSICLEARLIAMLLRSWSCAPCAHLTSMQG
jgi:hypothetical protein